MKKAQMMTAFVVIMAIAIFTTAQTAYAQTKTIDIPIYDRCKLNPFLLSVEIYEGDCIVSEPQPQKLKQDPLLSLSLSPIIQDTSPTPSSTPSLINDTPTPTQPEATPSPIPATPMPVEQSPLPETTQQPDSGSLNADVLFSMVNEVRSQSGLPAFQKDAKTCSIAQERLPQIYDEIMVNHDMHAGFYALHLPYWATENLIYQKTEIAALDWWMHSPIHRAAILGDSQYSCVACQGNACTEIFTNYLPK